MAKANNASQQPGTNDWAEWRPARLLEIAGLAILYFLAAKLGLKLAIVHPSASPVWPATGIALAALLLLGYRVWPGVWVGAFLANVTTTGSVATSLGIAMGNTLEAWLGAYLVNRLAGGRKAFDRVEDVFKFAGFAGLLSTAVSAAMGTASLHLGGLTRGPDQRSIWITWWLGDLVGALVVAPWLILLFQRKKTERTSRAALRGVIAAATVLALGVIVFAGFMPNALLNTPLAFVCIPPMVWAAFQLRRHESATLVVILSAIAIWGALRGYGPFMRASLNESLLFLQCFMGVVAVMNLVLGAAAHQRRQEHEALKQVKQELEKKVAERTTELENRIRAQEQAEAVLRQLSVRLMQIQDQERRTIARDLHDSTGQELVVLKMNLSRAGKQAAALSPELARDLAESGNIVEAVAKELRTLSYLLHPPLLDEVGLASALRWYVDGFVERTKVQVSLELSVDERLPSDLETAIFRIVQECLTNIHRHSGSTKATIRCARERDRIVLEVRDFGKGIPPEALHKISATGMSGVGLRGIRERAKLFHGELEIVSDQQGTLVRTVIPMHATAAAG